MTQNISKTLYFYQEKHLSCMKQDEISHSIFRHQSYALAEEFIGPNDTECCPLISDQLGSVLGLGSGNALTPCVYTAYGYSRDKALMPPLLKFAGEYRQTSNFYILGNGYRAFNAVSMRFQSPDNMSPFGKGGINAYAYCSGDPVNFRDPTGHWSAREYAARLPMRKAQRALEQRRPENLKTEGLTLEAVTEISNARAQGQSNHTRHENELIFNHYRPLSRNQITMFDEAIDSIITVADATWTSPRQIERKWDSYRFLNQQRGLISTALSSSNRSGQIIVSSVMDAKTLLLGKMVEHQRMADARRKRWIPERISSMNEQVRSS